ncbi:hypothetical protein K2173_012401 [Erythroxylum novogranatense]|uniref:Uncharacterized protein n=1 Tax=Erythroxylum novogranatense TaxID=1862640 RepID=A0AAV8U9W8_9ROSI|nr:hypothetical protein K2173_012401 [Erythroxylum novogranatense]
MQVTRRPRLTPSSTAGPRMESPTQGMVVGSRGSRFTALTPEASYDAPTNILPTVDSTRPLVGHTLSGNDQRRQKSLSLSSKRDESHQRGSILGASGNKAKSKGATSSSNRLSSSLGLPAPTGPLRPNPSRPILPAASTFWTQPSSALLGPRGDFFIVACGPGLTGLGISPAHPCEPTQWGDDRGQYQTSGPDGYLTILQRYYIKSRAVEIDSRSLPSVSSAFKRSKSANSFSDFSPRP